MADKKMRVTLVKSPIGYNKRQKATCQALGLTRINASRVLTDTPQMRGMVNSIQHLVTIEDVEEVTE